MRGEDDQMGSRRTHAPNRREANVLHTAPQTVYAAPKLVDSHMTEIGDFPFSSEGRLGREVRLALD